MNDPVETPPEPAFVGGAGGRVKVAFNLVFTMADGTTETRPVQGYLPLEDVNG